MPWVSYPFLKLSRDDISENVERDLISYAALPGAAGFVRDALSASAAGDLRARCMLREDAEEVSKARFVNIAEIALAIDVDPLRMLLA